MAGFDVVPKMGSPGDIVRKSSEQFNNMLQEMMKQKFQAQMKEKELAEQHYAHENTNKYQMGNLELDQKKLPSFLRLQNAQTNNQQAQADYNHSPLRLDLLKAKIEREKNGGSGRSGVQLQEENKYNEGVGLDNPDLRGDPNKIRQAANILAAGGNKFPDGKPINPMSPETKRSFDRLSKGTTTSPLVTQGIQAQQAEAELPVYDKYIKQGVHDTGYGNTTYGYSPKQIVDSLDVNNHAAQRRVGHYLAAQQLLYDRAALTLKINALPAGVTLADEIKKLSAQTIKARYPRETAEARQIASEEVAKAMKEGLKARQSIPLGASQAQGNRSDQNNNQKSTNWKIVDGKLVKDE